MLFEEGFILKIKLEDMLRLKLIDREMCIFRERWLKGSWKIQRRKAQKQNV